MSVIKGLAKFFSDLPWIAMLILVIFFDGLVGGSIRIGNGKETSSKVIGFILLITWIMSVLKILSVNLGIIGWICSVICAICTIADIITVITRKQIVLWAK